jgi:HEAT repeat protein
MSTGSRTLALILALTVAGGAMARAKQSKIDPDKAATIYAQFERGTRSADLNARGMSVFGIAWVPGHDGEVFVVDALKDPQWAARRMAILALYHQKKKAWREPLASALRDPSLKPRYDLFPVLAAMSKRDAVKLLKAAATDTKSPSRNKLIEDLVGCEHEFCHEVRAALAKSGDPILIDRIEARLADANAKERGALLRLLLDSKKDSAKARALKLVQKEPDPELVKPLDKLFRRVRDKELKREAAIALALCGSSKGARTLNKALGADDRDLNLRILKALGKIAGKADEGAMLQLLQPKPDGSVDLGFLEAVFDVYVAKGSDKPLPRVKMMLNEPDPKSRAVGVRFLAAMEGPVSLKTLHGLVQDGSVEVRRASVKAIASFARVDSVDTLGTALNDVDLEVKIAAIQGLGRINDVSVIRYLTFVVGDRNPTVKREALMALSQINDPSVVPTLQMGLVDPSVEVRSAALKGMLLNDRSHGRMYFQSALMWLPAPMIRELADALGKEAVPYLAEALRSDNMDLRMLAKDILAVSGQEGADALKATLTITEYAILKQAIVDFLYESKQADAVALTKDLLEGEAPVGVKVAVLRGLASLRDEATMPLLDKRLLDTAEVVRVAAGLAILQTLEPKVPFLRF